MADFSSSSLMIVFRPGGLAESQSPLKTLDTGQFITKEWKVIDGFRSAKFGMNPKSRSGEPSPKTLKSQKVFDSKCGPHKQKYTSNFHSQRFDP